jgi:GAF domain-containing protein
VPPPDVPVADVLQPEPSLAAAVLAAAAGGPLESTLDAVVRAAVERVGATYGALGVLTPDGSALDRFVIAGIDDAARARIAGLPEGHGLLGLLVERPEVLRLDDLAEHESSVGFPDGHPPMRSFLGVPVRVGEAVFGNLYLTEKRAGGSFTPEDVQIAQALAAAAGLAIGNARLAERAERRRRWGQAGTEVATALLSGTDPEDVLRQVTSRVAELADADLCGVLVPSDGDTQGDEESLTIITAVGSPMLDVEGVRIPVLGSHVGRAYREGRTLLVDDVSAEPEDGWHAEAPGEISAGHGSTMIVPLGARPALGVLLASRRHGRDPYDGETLDLLSGLVAQLTVALELARTQRRERRLQVQADRDRIARDLHDHVVQRVFATALGLDRLGRQLRTEHPEVAERLARSVDELDATMAEIRSAIFHLHEPADDVARAGVRARLTEVVRQVTEGHALRPDVRTDVAVEDLPKELVSDVVAVVRELVTNVVKHAGARRVTVSAEVKDGHLCLTVADDGSGLPQVGVRSGLANLADRAERNHGRLSTRSAPTGTEVRWSVPLD